MAKVKVCQYTCTQKADPLLALSSRTDCWRTWKEKTEKKQKTEMAACEGKEKMAARVIDMPLARVFCFLSVTDNLFKQAHSFYRKNECDNTETKLDKVLSKDIGCSFWQGCESSWRKYRGKLVLQYKFFNQTGFLWYSRHRRRLTKQAILGKKYWLKART